MKFKTRMISTAVAAAVGTFAGGAQAVNLNADNQGQVLIFPYYSAQPKGSTAVDTYINIINSDSVLGKAVKVRFIEGKASREVLDFNLYLSPNDMWAGAITRNAAGEPILRTWDNSCTAPEILTPAGASTSVSGATREAAFVNFDYTGDAVKDNSLTRAMEGYVEIIQMADLTSGTKTVGGSNIDTFAASKHAATGIPANCALIRTGWLNGSYSTVTDGMTAPTTSTLSGYGTLLNPLEGTDVTMDAVALAAFTATAIHNAPGSIQPDLGAVNPQISDVLYGSNEYNTNWTAGIIAGLTPAVPVSAVLMRNQVINEYAVAAAPTGLGSDWEVTLPTKRKHTEAPVGFRAPFSNALALTSTGWCELITLTAYDREEQITAAGLIFSPPPPAGQNSLCWEANVISIANAGTTSNVLGSLNVRQTLTVPYSAGWLRMAFTQASQVIPAAIIGANTIVTPLGGAPAAPAALSYYGLPVLGAMFQSFVNTGTVINYGGTSTHRYSRDIR